MKKFNKNSKTALLSISFVFGLLLPVSVFAASTPPLGAAASFSILADLSMAANGAGTTVSNAMGLSTGLAVSRTGVWLPVGRTEYFGPLSLAATAQSDAATASTNLATQPSDGLWSLNASPLPGVWTANSDATFTGTLTLNGGPTDVWVFQITSDFTFTGTVNMTGGAQACNVFWRVARDATINSGGPGSKFVGTLIAGRDVSLVNVGGVGVTVDGRILSGRSFTGAGGDSVSVPSCVVPPVPPTPTPSDIGGVFSMPWVVPLISVLKVPNPLALPLGPGLVTYDYTVSNIGPVEMNTIIVTDDKCSPVVYISGDTNGDSKLARDATWKYRCSTTLLQTTTNTVTATGRAYFFTAIDTANATVVVGASTTPPLIHIVKIPNVSTLPVSGGEVTYSYTITNPGTASLSNVSVSDDKCTGLPGRVVGHPGDLNKNNLLESNESWSFVCKSYITKTTTNTATAIGYANGLSVTDFALATVVVPQVLGVSVGFPNTGLPPDERGLPWNSILLVIGAFVISAFIPAKKELMF